MKLRYKLVQTGGQRPSPSKWHDPAMPSAPDNHQAHDYAERLRARLPRRHQELRERCGMSMYALWLKCGVSRDTISRVEAGETIPGVHVLARLSWGLGVTLTEFLSGIEDEK